MTLAEFNVEGEHIYIKLKMRTQSNISFSISYFLFDKPQNNPYNKMYHLPVQRISSYVGVQPKVRRKDGRERKFMGF